MVRAAARLPTDARRLGVLPSVRCDDEHTSCDRRLRELRCFILALPWRRWRLRGVPGSARVQDRLGLEADEHASGAPGGATGRGSSARRRAEASGTASGNAIGTPSGNAAGSAPGLQGAAPISRPPHRRAGRVARAWIRYVVDPNAREDVVALVEHPRPARGVRCLDGGPPRSAERMGRRPVSPARRHGGERKCRSAASSGARRDFIAWDSSPRQAPLTSRRHAWCPAMIARI
jgi:hypothetical protein